VSAGRVAVGRVAGVARATAALTGSAGPARPPSREGLPRREKLLRAELGWFTVA
jgi:hypothetical protein